MTEQFLPRYDVERTQGNATPQLEHGEEGDSGIPYDNHCHKHHTTTCGLLGPQVHIPLINNI